MKIYGTITLAYIKLIYTQIHSTSNQLTQGKSDPSLCKSRKLAQVATSSGALFIEIEPFFHMT